VSTVLTNCKGVYSTESLTKQQRVRANTLSGMTKYSDEKTSKRFKL